MLDDPAPPVQAHPSTTPLRALVVATLTLLASIERASADPQGTTTRVSVGAAGMQANGASSWSTPSADGRYIAFASDATNLVAGDTNATLDVFVRDRLTGTTERVSVGLAGVQGDDASATPFLSSNGRSVVFDSWAGNLVPGDTNGVLDSFAHDRVTGATERVTVSSTGVQANGPCEVFDLSPDGRFVVFHSLASNLVAGDSNADWDVFVRDRAVGQTQRASVGSAGIQGNDESSFGSISAAGRYVAFHSRASNLVPGDTNGASDAFVHDRQTGQTERVSVSTLGAQGNAGSGLVRISAEGRWVAFQSVASTLAPGDTNGVSDVFVRDRTLGETRRVSLGSSGGQANAASDQPRISGDGRYVVFRSVATNLVPGDINGFADIFVHDRQTSQTHLVSVDSSGAQAGGDGVWSWISADGRFVTFADSAPNLVEGDTNGVQDVFVHDRTPLVPVPFCHGDGSDEACPCANDGDAGHGCDNAQGTGGVRLHAKGTQAADDVALHGTGYPPDATPTVIALRSPGVELEPVPFGDGLRCVGAVGLVRLGATNAAGGTSTHPLGHGAGPGAFHYQLWYRNAPASFCDPVAASNVSSGLTIVWP